MNQPGLEERRRGPVSVHSTFDDYPLSVNEFRVVGRIARRNPCWESIPSMAADWSISPDTVRRALFTLVAIKAVTETRTKGQPTEYTLNPFSEWVGATEIESKLRAIDKGLRPKERRSLRQTIRAGIKRQIENAVEGLRADRRQKQTTPRTSNRGKRETGSSTHRGVVATETVPPSQEHEGTPSVKKGTPIAPNVDEGITSEGSPSEVNPIKDIPHTETLNAAPRARVLEAEVCVPIPFDLDQVRRKYAEAHRTQTFPFRRKGIDNPDGWLVRASDGRYDELLVLPWWREQEEIEERQAAAEAQEAAERLQWELDSEAARQRAEAEAAAESEAKRQREIEEAPQREAEQLAKEAERRARETADDEAIAKMKRMIEEGKKARPTAA